MKKPEKIASQISGTAALWHSLDTQPSLYSNWIGLAILIYQRTSPFRDIQCNYVKASPGHEDSFATDFVNPNRCTTKQDAYSLAFLATSAETGNPDDEVLHGSPRAFSEDGYSHLSGGSLPRPGCR